MSYPTQVTALPLLTLQIIAAMLIIPVIYLLDYALQQNALDITLTHNIKGKHITPITKTVAVSVLVLLIISLIIDQRILLFTSLIVALYLLSTVIRAFQAIPERSLDIATIQKRIVAGTTADVSMYAVSRASVKLHCQLNPVDPWIKSTPQSFTLDGSEIEFNLSISPPLSGPSYPQFQVSAIEPRGLVQINQIVQPLEMHIIPRARYAEWLATKYLGHLGSGATVFTTRQPEGVLIPKKGTEYFGSRAFQSGDQLSKIDWRHTLKLQQLIIKEYTEAGKQAAIVAVNLSVTDAEQADKLAFDLITTALTLSRQAIPTALAAYTHQKVILTTAVNDPKDILIQALSLVKNINVVEFTHQCLQPASMNRLRRNITHLKRATSEPAKRLLNMLAFEYQAIEQAAKTHAATVALSRVVRRISPPAIILIVSQLSHDAEALLVTTDRLTPKGFTTLRIEEGTKH